MKLRALSDSYDREIYTMSQKNAIELEIREIAELVSEKEKALERRESINRSVYVPEVKEGSLVDMVRKDALKLLKEIKEGILAVEYDGEYAIVDRELSELADLIKDKDRLIRSKVQYFYRGGTENPHLKEYFKMESAQEVE